MSLLLTWVLYAVLATAFLSVFFIWAVRTGQFTDQNRARYLPLATERGREEGADHGESGG